MRAVSTVHRRLDAKFRVGGMDATDLIGVLILSSVLNLIFGRFNFGPLVFLGLPAALLVALHFGKRGKPDGYLVHKLKFHFTSGEIHASSEERI